MTRSICLLASACLLVPLASAFGAKSLSAPSSVLTDEKRIVAVMVPREKLADDKIRFETVEPLWGETEAIETLRVSSDAHRSLELGGKYVVGYTRLRHAPKRREWYEIDPLGPKVHTVPTVGEAIWPDSEPLRKFIRAQTERQSLDAILGQLADPSRGAQVLVLSELVIRRELAPLVTAQDAKVLEKALSGGQLGEIAVEYMMRALPPIVERLGGDWAADVGRQLLGRHGTQLDLTSRVPAMLVATLQVMRLAGSREDFPLFDKHLTSNNPGVSKGAFRAMADIDPHETSRRVSALLEREGVHPDAQRIMRQFQTQHSSAGAH